MKIDEDRYFRRQTCENMSFSQPVEFDLSQLRPIKYDFPGNHHIDLQFSALGVMEVNKGVNSQSIMFS